MSGSIFYQIIFLAVLSLFLPEEILSQTHVFTRQDTLRGSITPERAWWDLVYYHLDISVNPLDSTIQGTNTVTYRVLKPSSVMQIDLQEPLTLASAVQDNRSLKFKKEGSVYRIELEGEQERGKVLSVVLSYGGKPRVSVRPPWSGGITWARDSRDIPFIASACQGDGASLWWPCKDHMYDEPDSMLISVTVPDYLTDVSNGRLRSIIRHDDKTATFNWFVANPVNNYGVNINIGDYVHFGETFNGEKGPLSCDYYVLRDNLEKARIQFQQAPKMLEAFEYWFGPYPFYEDGYKLVEVPYLGMEHQSSVTYGNGFENGYRGTDLSGTGWGLKFDFIIIHESGHEWFANSITYEDIADMWVHESFTNYSENLYIEYYYGKAAGSEYVLGSRRNILNDRPIVGVYNVNSEGSHDMYYKGGNMLHTLRQIINDDEKWRSILRGLNREYYHKVVKGSQIEAYLSEKTGMDLRPFFNQYLRDVRIPVFEYYFKGREFSYRWTNCVPGFNIPIKIDLSGETLTLNPTEKFITIPLKSRKTVVKVDPGWYVAAMDMTGK
jgi:aminopeptidase N